MWPPCIPIPPCTASAPVVVAVLRAAITPKVTMNLGIIVGLLSERISCGSISTLRQAYSVASEPELTRVFTQCSERLTAFRKINSVQQDETQVDLGQESFGAA